MRYACNQTGFCKYRQTCRKRHENLICPEDHDFKSTECLLRHPKVWRSLKKDGICKFKEGCAYKHQINHNTEMVEKHAKEVINLQLEISQMKSVITEMEAKFFFLHEAIENIT